MHGTKHCIMQVLDKNNHVRLKHTPSCRRRMKNRSICHWTNNLRHWTQRRNCTRMKNPNIYPCTQTCLWNLCLCGLYVGRANNVVVRRGTNFHVAHNFWVSKFSNLKKYALPKFGNFCNCSFYVLFTQFLLAL